MRAINFPCDERNFVLKRELYRIDRLDKVQIYRIRRGHDFFCQFQCACAALVERVYDRTLDPKSDRKVFDPTEIFVAIIREPI